MPPVFFLQKFPHTRKHDLKCPLIILPLLVLLWSASIPFCPTTLAILFLQLILNVRRQCHEKNFLMYKFCRCPWSVSYYDFQQQQVGKNTIPNLQCTVHFRNELQKMFTWKGAERTLVSWLNLLSTAELTSETFVAVYKYNRCCLTLLTGVFVSPCKLTTNMQNISSENFNYCLRCDTADTHSFDVAPRFRFDTKTKD